MYLEEISKPPTPLTFVKIKYDCCGRDHILKWKDADKNFQKNQGKHICRICGLKANNPAKRPEVKAKALQTNLERYGTSVAANTKESKKRIAAERDEEFYRKRAEKTKQTNLKLYGVEHAAQSEEKKAKAKKTFQEKYGTDHPMQNAEVQAKKDQTCLDRYGVDNVAKLPEVREKMIKTMMENFGVEHYNQLPEMRDYLRENCKEWLADSYAAGGPNKGIIRPEEWNNKQRETVLDLIDQGKWNVGPGYSITGVYRSAKCKKKAPGFRSSYELKVHWHLDNNPDVEWYDYEPFRVPYRDAAGKQRAYIIDFVVKYRGKDRLVAIEVKNDYTKDRLENSVKYIGFKENCESIADLEIWANDQITGLELDIDTLLKSDLVTRRK
jgi:hypothetical protein